MNADTTDHLDALTSRIERALPALLPADEGIAPRLLQAMRYSICVGGKRVRPLLVLATCETLGGDLERAVAPACALEYVHTYSLIHDDLPAMDNDVLRRGKPTCHVAFDDATAILAGNGLLTHALQLLATCAGFAASTRVEMLTCVAEAAGCHGMLAGQCVDLASTGKTLDEPHLEAMHRAKTGALIRAAVRLGAMASGNASAADLAHLDLFASHLGLAFQVADDVLDATGNTAHLGKTAGSDAAQGKNTYPQLLTLAGAQRRADELGAAALAALAPFGAAATTLHALAVRLRQRDH